MHRNSVRGVKVRRERRLCIDFENLFNMFYRGKWLIYTTLFLNLIHKKKIMIYRSCPPQITFSITLSRCPIPQINASLFPIAFDFSFSTSQALCLKSKWVQLYSYGGVYTWLTQEHQNLTPARYQKLASSQETDCVGMFSHFLKHWWLFLKNI